MYCGRGACARTMSTHLHDLRSINASAPLGLVAAGAHDPFPQRLRHSTWPYVAERVPEALINCRDELFTMPRDKRLERAADVIQVLSCLRQIEQGENRSPAELRCITSKPVDVIGLLVRGVLRKSCGDQLLLLILTRGVGRRTTQVASSCVSELPNRRW